MTEVTFLLETFNMWKWEGFCLMFTKVMEANTMKFCFYNEGRDYLCKARKVSLADWFCRG